MDKQPDPNQYEYRKEERESNLREYIALAKEIIETGEVFSFPGINSESMTRLKADEELIPDYAQYTTPVDELIEKFKAQGVKVVSASGHEDDGNYFAIPSGSTDINMDGLRPMNLAVTDGMDERLKALILAHQKSNATEKTRFD